MKFLTTKKTQVIISPVVPLPSSCDKGDIIRATQYLVDVDGDGNLADDRCNPGISAHLDYVDGLLTLSKGLTEKLEIAGFEEYNVTVNIPVTAVEA